MPRRQQAVDGVHSGLPQNGAGIGIGIERVYRVMLCGHVHDIVPHTANREVRDPQWLRINCRVDWAGKEFAEIGWIDVRNCIGSKIC